MTDVPRPNVRIHPTADVSPKAILGEGTSVWNQAQIRENAKLGKTCVVSKNVYIDFDVVIGDNCKIQNNCSIYHGATLGNGVFVGPHCIITNDRFPRAVNADGSAKGNADWTVSKTRVDDGAALGAGTILVCGITVGAWAMTGSGSVVTHDVPPHGLVMGNPARLHSFVCKCGNKLQLVSQVTDGAAMSCPTCKNQTIIPKNDFEKLV
ncbi:N-acetyltransferase [Candidatus Micrarchaeota archaeon]|nr:N-acetyltransferase [Candidatus Micrarchaeota archaeon]